MESNLEQINRLLDGTQTLLLYEKQLTQATGEHFNVFEILRIGSREVTTHSPMLVELLNPNGRHGMGPQFLEIFVKQPFVKKLSLDLEVDLTTRVRPEFPTGPKCEESGGRIDILISDNNSNELVIENKINTTDKDNQLNRYLHDRPRAKVLYLTLDGDEPGEAVSSKHSARFARVSYKNDIINWLEACYKEAARLPLVRETIAQYINLIKVLTGQNTNSRMNHQITKSILRDKDSLEAYFTLLGSKEHVINELLRILEGQFKDIGAECGLQAHFDPSDFRSIHDGSWFFDEKMKERDLCICFQFNQNNFRGLDFGIARLTNEEKDAPRTDVTTLFESIFGQCKVNAWWLAYKSWPERGDWWNDGTFQHILTGEFKKDLKENVKKLAKILRSTN